MSDREPPVLDVRVERQIHPALRLDVALALGSECGIVFGPSGAGKTTLLRLIAGLDRPDAGHVRLAGEPLADVARRLHRPLRHRRIGMIFQDDLLFPHLDVAANIRFGLRGRPRVEAAARLAEVADLCGVGHLLGRRPETLSGGERQRVGLARSLAPRPRLLLCDEPVSALDLESRFTLLERLRAVQRAEAIPILYVTHAPAEAVALGTRLFLLRAGRIVAEGPPLDVLAAADPRPGMLEGLRNVFAAGVLDHAPGDGSTRLRLDGGPDLIVPYTNCPPGSPVSVAIRADDVLLARGPVADLSARNRIRGTIRRLVRHGTEVEVLVGTGALTWVVSLVAPAVGALALEPGVEVELIVKARSCRLLGAEAPGS